jgi:hypothetical protein
LLREVGISRVQRRVVKAVTEDQYKRVCWPCGTIAVTALFYLGEQYGSITPLKGSPIDLNDWMNEFGGMGTFLLAAYVFSLVKTARHFTGGKIAASGIHPFRGAAFLEESE